MKFEALKIRPLESSDWPNVKSIYEQGLKTGIATFEISAPSWEKWNRAHLDIGRLVATYNHEVVGWVALSPVSSRCVYGGVAELSVYIGENQRGKGIGKLLMKQAITESEKNNIWTLQSGVFRENIASIKLHESVGFRIIGYREKIGRLNGEWKDNILLERRSQIVGID